MSINKPPLVDGQDASASEVVAAHLRWAVELGFNIAGADGPLMFFAACFGAHSELDYYAGASNVLR